MNTRRKPIQAKPEKPSTHWHLMSESFHPLFKPAKRQHVEYWYNMSATDIQREKFREICKGIFQQDTCTPDPPYPTATTETMELEQVRLLIKNYGAVLSEEEGKPKARVWLLHCGTSSRDRNYFRSVFTGCQTTYDNRSVMQADYTPPEVESYSRDRTHFVRSVDWNSQKNREEMQALETERREHSGVATVVSPDKLPSAIEDERRRVGHAKPRVTKPKSQFDGVNVLATLGYEGVPPEEAIAQLKAKRDADRDAEWYYVDKGGSTVYTAKSSRGQTGGAAGGAPAAAGLSRGGGILTSVTSEPMTRWVNKTCD